MPEPSFFSEGHESRREDTLWKIEQKILAALNDGAGGGGGGLYTGSFADPNGNVTPSDADLAALYTQDDAAAVNQWRWSVADQVWYQNTGP